MFKPSLKRSRIPDQSLGVDTQRRQSYPTNYASTDPKKQTIALRPNLIIPGQLLQSPELVDNKPFTHILNPLTSAYFAYPEAVQ